MLILLSLPGLKRPGRGLNHPLYHSAQGKERVELHLHFFFVISWLVKERNLLHYLQDK